ncbi:MAG: hypothetical protein JWO67_4069 [Streptosporangiaceae bacterium]|nr:hypothetical protein [Streptosporangiaceae bacterium]
MPDRRDLRASHDDRDQVVEQLRVAAGDGRLTAEELDERLETALKARTYGELEMLLLDLPAIAGAAPAPAPVAKELVQLQTRNGNLHRAGPWAVPRRLEVEVRSGNVVVDFTQAIVTQRALDLTVSVSRGNLKLIVPPEVAVDVDSVAIHSGNVRQRQRRDPGTPVKLLVTVSGNVRSGNVIVRGPRRTFWAWLLRRPAHPGSATPSAY